MTPNSATGNILTPLPDALDDEVCTDLCRAEHVTIKRIVSHGQTSPASGWYDQDDNEWVIVLQGEAEVAFADADPVRLVAGGYLNIPAHTRHRVAWTAPDTDTVWLAIHYG